MGLLNKFRSRLGRLGARVSSIGSRFVSRFPPRTRGILGKVAKVGKFAKIGGKFIPGVGAALTVLSVGGLISGVRKRRREKRQVVSAGTAISGVSAAKGLGRLAGVKRIGLIAAGVGAAAFVAEQIAEKLGVRGGVGFVGKRPRKPTAKRKPTKRGKRRVGRKAAKGKRKKRTHASPRHKGHKRVSFITKAGQKVSFLVRKKGSPRHR